MIGILAAAGVGLAWLGSAVLVLADARRGLSVGLLVAALGLAAVRAVEGDLADAGLLFAGGLLGALAGRRRNPRHGWGLLAAGSTPRIVMCLVLGGGALWFAIGGLDGPGEPAGRAAAAIVMALGGGRLLATREARAGLAAASLVALGGGALAALATTDATGALVGAVATVALNLIPTSEADIDG